MIDTVANTFVIDVPDMILFLQYDFVEMYHFISFNFCYSILSFRMDYKCIHELS